MLKPPATGKAEIQEIAGRRFLVAELPAETATCDDHIAELAAGRPVVVPFSKRGHMIGRLKAQGVFTTSKQVVAGQWIAFFPCAPREWK